MNKEVRNDFVLSGSFYGGAFSVTNVTNYCSFGGGSGVGVSAVKCVLVPFDCYVKYWTLTYINDTGAVTIAGGDSVAFKHCVRGLG